MTDADLVYDLALDLFGHPPKPAVVCPTCGVRAEPFRGLRCWLCVNTYRRPPEYRIRLVGDGGSNHPDPERDKRIAEHAERVARELGEVSS